MMQEQEIRRGARWRGFVYWSDIQALEPIHPGLTILLALEVEADDINALKELAMARKVPTSLLDELI